MDELFSSDEQNYILLAFYLGRQKLLNCIALQHITKDLLRAFNQKSKHATTKYSKHTLACCLCHEKGTIFKSLWLKYHEQQKNREPDEITEKDIDKAWADVLELWEKVEEKNRDSPSEENLFLSYEEASKDVLARHAINIQSYIKEKYTEIETLNNWKKIIEIVKGELDACVAEVLKSNESAHKLPTSKCIRYDSRQYSSVYLTFTVERKARVFAKNLQECRHVGIHVRATVEPTSVVAKFFMCSKCLGKFEANHLSILEVLSRFHEDLGSKKAPNDGQNKDGTSRSEMKQEGPAKANHRTTQKEPVRKSGRTQISNKKYGTFVYDTDESLDIEDDKKDREFVSDLLKSQTRKRKLSQGTAKKQAAVTPISPTAPQSGGITMKETLSPVVKSPPDSLNKLKLPQKQTNVVIVTTSPFPTRPNPTPGTTKFASAKIVSSVALPLSGTTMARLVTKDSKDYKMVSSPVQQSPLNLQKNISKPGSSLLLLSATSTQKAKLISIPTPSTVASEGPKKKQRNLSLDSSLSHAKENNQLSTAIPLGTFTKPKQESFLIRVNKNSIPPALLVAPKQVTCNVEPLPSVSPSLPANSTKVLKKIEIPTNRIKYVKSVAISSQTLSNHTGGFLRLAQVAPNPGRTSQTHRLVLNRAPGNSPPGSKYVLKQFPLIKVNSPISIPINKNTLLKKLDVSHNQHPASIFYVMPPNSQGIKPHVTVCKSPKRPSTSFGSTTPKKGLHHQQSSFKTPSKKKVVKVESKHLSELVAEYIRSHIPSENTEGPPVKLRRKDSKATPQIPIPYESHFLCINDTIEKHGWKAYWYRKCRCSKYQERKLVESSNDGEWDYPSLSEEDLSSWIPRKLSERSKMILAGKLEEPVKEHSTNKLEEKPMKLKQEVASVKVTIPGGSKTSTGGDEKQRDCVKSTSSVGSEKPLAHKRRYSDSNLMSSGSETGPMENKRLKVRYRKDKNGTWTSLCEPEPGDVKKAKENKDSVVFNITSELEQYRNKKETGATKGPPQEHGLKRSPRATKIRRKDLVKRALEFQYKCKSAKKKAVVSASRVCMFAQFNDPSLSNPLFTVVSPHPNCFRENPDVMDRMIQNSEKKSLGYYFLCNKPYDAGERLQKKKRSKAKEKDSLMAYIRSPSVLVPEMKPSKGIERVPVKVKSVIAKPKVEEKIEAESGFQGLIVDHLENLWNRGKRRPEKPALSSFVEIKQKSGVKMNPPVYFHEKKKQKKLKQSHRKYIYFRAITSKSVCSNLQALRGRRVEDLPTNEISLREAEFIISAVVEPKIETNGSNPPLQQDEVKPPTVKKQSVVEGLCKLVSKVKSLSRNAQLVHERSRRSEESLKIVDHPQTRVGGVCGSAPKGREIVTPSPEVQTLEESVRAKDVSREKNKFASDNGLLNQNRELFEFLDDLFPHDIPNSATTFSDGKNNANNAQESSGLPTDVKVKKENLGSASFPVSDHPPEEQAPSADRGNASKDKQSADSGGGPIASSSGSTLEKKDDGTSLRSLLMGIVDKVERKLGGNEDNQGEEVDSVAQSTESHPECALQSLESTGGVRKPRLRRVRVADLRTFLNEMPERSGVPSYRCIHSDLRQLLRFKRTMKPGTSNRRDCGDLRRKMNGFEKLLSFTANYYSMERLENLFEMQALDKLPNLKSISSKPRSKKLRKTRRWIDGFVRCEMQHDRDAAREEILRAILQGPGASVGNEHGSEKTIESVGRDMAQTNLEEFESDEELSSSLSTPEVARGMLFSKEKSDVVLEAESDISDNIISDDAYLKSAQVQATDLPSNDEHYASSGQCSAWEINSNFDSSCAGNNCEKASCDKAPDNNTSPVAVDMPARSRSRKRKHKDFQHSLDGSYWSDESDILTATEINFGGKNLNLPLTRGKRAEQENENRVKGSIKRKLRGHGYLLSSMMDKTAILEAEQKLFERHPHPLSTMNEDHQGDLLHVSDHNEPPFCSLFSTSLNVERVRSWMWDSTSAKPLKLFCQGFSGGYSKKARALSFDSHHSDSNVWTGKEKPAILDNKRKKIEGRSKKRRERAKEDRPYHSDSESSYLASEEKKLNICSALESKPYVALVRVPYPISPRRHRVQSPQKLSPISDHRSVCSASKIKPVRKTAIASASKEAKKCKSALFMSYGDERTASCSDDVNKTLDMVEIDVTDVGSDPGRAPADDLDPNRMGPGSQPPHQTLRRGTRVRKRRRADKESDASKTEEKTSTEKQKNAEPEKRPLSRRESSSNADEYSSLVDSEKLQALRESVFAELQTNSSRDEGVRKSRVESWKSKKVSKTLEQTKGRRSSLLQSRCSTEGSFISRLIEYNTSSEDE